MLTKYIDIVLEFLLGEVYTLSHVFFLVSFVLIIIFIFKGGRR